MCIRDRSNEETEDICLSVLAGQSTPDAGIEDMIDEKVAEILPNVRLEWECVDWGDNFDADLNARFAAGDIPAVSYTHLDVYKRQPASI